MNKVVVKLQNRWLKRITRWAEKQGLSYDGAEAWIGEHQLLEVRFVGEKEIHFNMTQYGQCILAVIEPVFNEHKIEEIIGAALKKDCIILADDGLYYDLKKVTGIYCELSFVQSKTRRYISVDGYMCETPESSCPFGITNFLKKYRYISRIGNIKRSYDQLQRFERGDFEKDLFWPIKKGVNRHFFGDDYHVKNFYVEQVGQ